MSVLDCEHRTPPAAEGGYPYVAIPNLREGRIDVRDARTITPTDFVEWTRRALPRANDVVLSRRTNPGETAHVPDGLEFAVGQNLMLLRATGAAVEPRFLRWLVRGPEWWRQIARYLNVGAVFDSLRVVDIPKFSLTIPPIEEQREIARVLGAFDDKIELNRRMNETLEALARAIFTSWFVDFDPVRVKAEGRLPVGMDAETAALFPDSFEDSPLGPIPSGWHAGELGDVVSMNTRSRLPEYPHREIKYVDIASVTRGRLEAAAPMPLDAAPSRARRLVKDGDVIWSCVRPNRRSYLRIDHPPDNLVVSTGFVVLTPTVVPSSYLYLSVTTDEFVDYLTANADGSAYPAVRPENFDRSPMLIPENPPLHAFDDRVLPMLRRMAANERENNTLAVIRDSLLPKLVSGDIRIGPGAHPEGSGDKFHATCIIG